MITIIFTLIICILFIEFGFNQFLSVLNIRHSQQPLPAILSTIYDKDEYAKQQTYLKTNGRFGMLSGTFSFVLILTMYTIGGFGWLDRLVAQWTDHSIFQSLLFFGILFIASELISIPFDWYNTFVIEEKFQFNKVTPGIFIGDRLKSSGLSLLLGGGILYLIIWLYSLTPEYFWLFAFGTTNLFSLLMTMFYSEIIVPLFNKQTPLPKGELRDAIEQLASKANFNLKNIFVIDGSKRSTKANAYFAGLGPKKRIVLYDTLIEQIDNEEIEAVLAHEIGHYKHKHVLKSYAFSMPFSLLLFYLLGWMLNSDVLAQVLGGDQAVFHLNAIAFFILYAPIATVFDLCGNVLSRKYEYQADAYAKQHGYGQALIGGLKKLSTKSLSNLMPHPLYVFIHYSHPTLYQRILKLK